MRQYLIIAPLVGGVLVGCASQKRADAALEEMGKAVTAQHVDAIRFAPDAFAGVMQSYNEARRLYTQKDWRGAIRAAREAQAKARALPPAIGEGRARAKAEWPARADSSRAMLSALETRLSEWRRSGKYPTGVSEEQAGQMRLVLDSLNTGLDQAQRAFDDGSLGDAVHAMDRIRRRAGQLAVAAGMARRNPHGT